MAGKEPVLWTKLLKPLTVTLGNGSTSVTDQCVDLHLTIHGQKFGTRLIILEDLAHDLILGMDFLQRYQAKLDIGMDQLTLEPELQLNSLVAQGQLNVNSQLILDKELEIPAGHECLVEVRAPCFRKGNVFVQSHIPRYEDTSPRKPQRVRKTSSKPTRKPRNEETTDESSDDDYECNLHSLTKRIQMARFKGEPNESLDSWLCNLEMHFNPAWREKDKVALLKSYLDGKALTNMSALFQPGHRPTYEEAVDYLTRSHQAYEADEFYTLRKLKIRPGEDYHYHSGYVNRLVNRLKSLKGCGKSVTEPQKITYFIASIKAEVAEYVERRLPETLEAAARLAARYNGAGKDQQETDSKVHRRKEFSALNVITQENRPEPRLCFSCQSPDHLYRECPNRRKPQYENRKPQYNNRKGGTNYRDNRPLYSPPKENYPGYNNQPMGPTRSN